MIRIQDISVRYGDRAAVDGVGFELHRAHVTVLLGPSGAGKTTLLKALNGIVRPSAGDILDAHGRSIFADAGSLRAHGRTTAMVFQSHDLVGRLSAHANVLNGRLAHVGRIHALLALPRRDRLLAMAALERVGLLEKAFQRADRLSGGEQQRVGIARAMVQGARLLLADEPVASLDPATAIQILDLIADLTRTDRLTTVVSLHQVELAQRYGDRIIGMNAGRLVFDGPPGDLTQQALSCIYAAAPRGLSPAGEDAADVSDHFSTNAFSITN